MRNLEAIGNHCYDRWMDSLIPGRWPTASTRNDKPLDVNQVLNQDVEIAEEEVQVGELLSCR
jgi:hypothetical protein